VRIGLATSGAILGGSFYLDVARGWLLSFPVLGPLFLVLLVAVAWIVPATVILWREIKGTRLDPQWLVWVPRVALFGILVLVHAVDPRAMQANGTFEPWVWACVGTALVWSVLHRTLPVIGRKRSVDPRAQEMANLNLVHIPIDFVGVAFALFTIGPYALGAVDELRRPDSSFATGWLVAISVLAAIATFAWTADMPWTRDLGRRFGIAILAITVYVLVILGAEGRLDLPNLMSLVATALIGCLSIWATRPAALARWQRIWSSASSP
jgi:hypothetical protein